MIQIFLIQILRGVCECPEFTILPYLTQLIYLVSHLLEVERGVRCISPNVVHPTYINKNAQLKSIVEYFQLSLCIVRFLILFKCMLHPRLDFNGIIEFSLDVQKCKFPIISCFCCNQLFE